MVHLSDDILKYIVSFFYHLDVCFPDIPAFDIVSLSNISQVNKKCYNIVFSRNIWEEYYRSFDNYWVIAPDANHIGIQTYHKCGLTNYPGWMHIHTEIPPSIQKCNNIYHYDSHIKINKCVRWKNLNYHCAKITYENYIRKNGEWKWSDQIQLEQLRCAMSNIKIKIKKLEHKKKITEKMYKLFLKYLPSNKQNIIIEKINSELFSSF